MSSAAIFMAHGSPMLALDEGGAHALALRRFAASVPLPRAIVVVSAHGEAPGPIRVGAAERPDTIHDFHGFPPALYRVRYPAPGAPALAREIVGRLEAAGLEAALDPEAGFDHGVWVPLRLAFPRAEVPVVSVSLPARRAPGDVLRMGRALATLRDEGALLVGSGVIVHNLRRARLDRVDAPVDAWARAFDDWVAARAAALDAEALLAYRERAPDAALAVPTPEHFDPLFFVLGAAQDGDRVDTVAEGFEYGNLSMRSLALRPAQPEEDRS
jgi:4,5-DOPA dioxygenase extradiol